MFNLKEKLEFLEDGIDFPFYNDIPKLSSKEWGILAIAVIVFFLFTYMPWILPQYRFFVYFLIMIIPLIYVCKGDYSIFFKKLKLRDAKTIILCYILYIIYAAVVGAIMTHFGNPPATDASLASKSLLMAVVSLIFQLVGEEFFKIFLLLIFMYLIYKFTGNRNMAIWIGVLATLLIFGIAHMSAYGNLMQVLLIQGLGSIFDLYAYMKTKNVLVSYILHLIIDLVSSIVYVVGTGMVF